MPLNEVTDLVQRLLDYETSGGHHFDGYDIDLATFERLQLDQTVTCMIAVMIVANRTTQGDCNA